MILGNAVAWAVCMLAVAWVLKSSDNQFTVTVLLTAGWFATNSMITGWK